ncbi:sigma-70 family RNA polymerase sigma factor [Streptomyces sp. NPDC093252]|uniref:sigma-70 family RNA polymerase sigma factor n=1 Tax=Streptomyces sp. NPDC093252 TaxID=3154980 RepID=UPI003439B970
MHNTHRGGPDPGVVTAARSGDRQSLEQLVRQCLPLVYNIVGRALNGHADVDDVVQETLLRMVRGLPKLRDPSAFRSWLVSITIRQVRNRENLRASDRDRRAHLEDAEAIPSPALDFVGLTILRLGLTEQRREVAEATRWLDPDDQELLSLWWLEETGELERAELATALGLSDRHAAVRVQRMKQQMEVSRLVVRALAAVPRCTVLDETAATWGGTPSPLWRKRFARHVRDCPVCAGRDEDLLPMGGLLSGLPLVALPSSLDPGRVLTAVTDGGATPSGPGDMDSGPEGEGGGSVLDPAPGVGAPPSVSAHSATEGHGLAGAHRRRGPRPRGTRGRTIAGSAGAVAVVVTVTALIVTHFNADSSTPADTRTPPAPIPTTSTPTPTPTPSPSPSPSPSVSSGPSPSPRPSAESAPPQQSAAAPVPVAAGDKKGVGVWDFNGVSQALGASGARWYYNWNSQHPGVSTPASASFVPMIWGEASVTDAQLTQARANGPYLLGFNEPDMAEQSNMSVDRALELWPRLMAAGRVLGSPAVATGADTPGGWLDRFMSGAEAKGYRVDFITVHWYGGDFRTAQAVDQLTSYLAAVYERYRKPIWLTEYALIDFSQGTRFPSAEQQADFVTASTEALNDLSYVQRYAWFGLGADPAKPSSGLFTDGTTATAAGRAFRAAR